jgi:protein tyrosine phosphatase
MIEDFSIACNVEKTYIGFVKRTLFIRRAAGSRQVIQLHYNEWGRNGLPTDLSSLAIFMEIIQSKRQTPIVVHCR